MGLEVMAIFNWIGIGASCWFAWYACESSWKRFWDDRHDVHQARTHRRAQTKIFALTAANQATSLEKQGKEALTRG